MLAAAAAAAAGLSPTAEDGLRTKERREKRRKLFPLPLSSPAVKEVSPFPPSHTQNSPFPPTLRGFC